MSAQTSMLHIRVDDDTKEQATVALSAMGLTMSDAVRLFLRRVVIDQAFPLELKVPNAETLAAMEESRAMMAKGRAGFATADELLADLEKNSQAYTGRSASFSQLHQSLFKGLAALVALGSVRHGKAQRGHVAVDGQRCAAGARVARPPSEGQLVRPP